MSIYLSNIQTLDFDVHRLRAISLSFEWLEAVNLGEFDMIKHGFVIWNGKGGGKRGIVEVDFGKTWLLLIKDISLKPFFFTPSFIFWWLIWDFGFWFGPVKWLDGTLMLDIKFWTWFFLIPLTLFLPLWLLCITFDIKFFLFNDGFEWIVFEWIVFEWIVFDLSNWLLFLINFLVLFPLILLLKPETFALRFPFPFELIVFTTELINRVSTGFNGSLTGFSVIKFDS